MRSALRDAELPPPADGWERLQRELGSAVPGPQVPAEPRSRGPVWRIYWPRIAAAAAAVLIVVVAGEFLLRPDKALKQDGNVIASVAESGATAVTMPQPAGPESTQELLAKVVGLSEERIAETSPSRRRQTLLAAVSPQGTETEAAGRTGVRMAANAVERQTSQQEVSQPGTSQQKVSQQENRQSGSRQAAKRSTDRTTEGQAAKHATDRAADRQTAGVLARTAFSDEPFTAYVAPRKKASFSLFAGGSVTGGSAGPGNVSAAHSSVSSDVSSLVGNGDNLAFMHRYNSAENSYRHHQPLSFGLSVRKEFAHGLSLESGVIYSLLRSDVRMRYSSDDVSQKLHFVGVPLRLNWQFFERGRFSLYIGAGGMVEKCVSAKFGSTSVDEKGVQWSAHAAAGAQYRLGGIVGLYFEPEGSYYFTHTELNTARTDSPLTLTLRLGVRLSF